MFHLVQVTASIHKINDKLLREKFIEFIYNASGFLNKSSHLGNYVLQGMNFLELNIYTYIY